uniref:Mediator complex subunit 15 n=1 Tax=Eptatretus burgeri TaxID=7764 RepID=A0A8C4QFU1_EPTBU
MVHQQSHQMMLASMPRQIRPPRVQGGNVPVSTPSPQASMGIVPTPTSTSLGHPVVQVSHSPLMISSPSQSQGQNMLPPPTQTIPSPQSAPSQQGCNINTSTAASPGFMPSPSPQPSHSPVPIRTPQTIGVQSPSPLNTPGNPGSVASPAARTQTDEQQYLEKLRQLSKYIDPLRRMINKIDKNEDRKKDLSKMKSLLDILSDPNKRCSLQTLQKCEIALEKLKNDMAVPTPPPPPPATGPKHMCQPLLDAVLQHIRSPLLNHTLHRTFGPAMLAIHGPPLPIPGSSSKKRKLEEEEKQSIPNVLQGEVARLHSKFIVNLDPAQHSSNGTVHIVCKLDDKGLPSVPALQLSVPANYPDQSPEWTGQQLYESSPFLKSIQKELEVHLMKLPDRHSLSSVLSAWAMSVRQACFSATLHNQDIKAVREFLLRSAQHVCVHQCIFSCDLVIVGAS